MKRLLSSTTALSVALATFQPLPLMAQTLTEDGRVLAADGTTVLCEPVDGVACDLQATLDKVAAEAAAAASVATEADAAAAAQAEADAAAAAQAEADAAAAAQTDADAAATAQAEADAAMAAQAEADAAAAAQAEADAAATAQAEADAAAAAQAEADAAAAAQAEAEAAAAAAVAKGDAEAVAAAEAAALAAAEAAAAAQAEADAAATAQAAAEADAAVAAEAAAQATATGEAEAVVTGDTATESEAPVELAVEPVAPEAMAEPVEAPVPTEAEVESLTAILDQPADVEPVELEAAAALVETPHVEGEKPAFDTNAEVTTQTVTEEQHRSSAEEFRAKPVAVDGGKKSGLSDLEKVGLIALGALVVGAILKDGKEVVSNTGDRVVVRNPDGNYVVYKDDDALIRSPGSTVRTETYDDGSTRTIVEKTNGTQIVTIRDASGRVLRRATYDDRGRELVLIDDLEEAEVVVISDLPKPPRDRVTISTSDGGAALRARLAAVEAQNLGRSFSLRQIREIREVRDLAATIDVDTITFDSGSAAISAVQAENLADLGALIREVLADNPGEVFLIEGHTDAVGSGASNLALSDRRAESVALALTEYFDVPPENLVVQGYGEAELRVATATDERANRRVAVRIITPLMRTASN